MSAFTGTGTLVRFVLRRDRVRLSVWILALVGTVAATIPALDEMFATEAERQGRAALMESPTGVVFGGPGYGLADYTLGPMLVNELTMSLFIALAIMNILHVVRHTRAEEESGRAELLRSSVLGSNAQTSSALLTIALVDLIIGGLIFLSMIAYDLPVHDSLAYGLGLGLGGLAFAAVTAVCAQLAEHARTASGLAFLAIGVFFFVRVVGDMAEPGGTTLSWFSPFSWTQQARPFDGLRWWPLALYVGFVLVVFVLAYVLAGRRDLGAGLLSARPGPAEAGRGLTGMFTVHLFQQRGAIITWTVAVFVFALAFGSLATEVEGMVESNPDLAVMLGDDTDDLVAGFLGTMVTYVLMAAGAYGALSVLRAWGEENAGRAELALSTAVSRTRWFGTALFVATLSTLLITLVGGLGLGVGAATVLESAGWIGQMLEAALAQMPAALVFGALAALLLGFLPRFLPLVWAWLGYSVLVTMFGVLVGVPDVMIDMSAFEILAQPPMEDFEVAPFLIYLAAVLAAGALSLVGFRHRDLVTG